MKWDSWLVSGSAGPHLIINILSLQNKGRGLCCTPLLLQPAVEVQENACFHIWQSPVQWFCSLLRLGNNQGGLKLSVSFTIFVVLFWKGRLVCLVFPSLCVTALCHTVLPKSGAQYLLAP